MTSLIRYFTTKHFLVNLVTLLVFVGGVIAWNTTSKEELPDITFNTVRISTNYPGASAADVEFYVTKPIEEALQGIDGVNKITSSTGQSSSSIAVELEKSVTDVDKAVTEIQNQVSSVSLPEEVLKDPRVRVFETSKKAIIDISFYNEDHTILDVKSRKELQAYVRGLENKLIAKSEIFEVQRNGYLVEEINIKTNPTQFTKYEIPLNTIAQEIQQNHVRTPAGTLKSGRHEQVTLLSELSQKKALDNLVIQGGFDSAEVKLNTIATITDGFEDRTTIYKTNGREAVIINVVKNSKYGIIETLKIVKDVADSYQENVLKGTSIKMVFLDDESINVKNRLSIIASNGLIGFVLIVLTLFIFLNMRSGLWVALGIPFTLCTTLIAGNFLGYTINGITLSAIIIVLGIVVDDAIIVAENITRRLNDGEPLKEAAVNGTKEVAAPILASILTTCAAFIPLLLFTGRFGSFIMVIPPIIFLMLISSLVESFFILPAHMMMIPKKTEAVATGAKVWFKKWENAYEQLLLLLIPKRYLIFFVFLVMMISTGYLVKKEFKFVMFPGQDSREIALSGMAPDAKSSVETAMALQPFEEYLRRFVGKESVGIRTQVARGRRGSVAQENQFVMGIELIPADEREKSTQALLEEIKAFSATVPGLSKVRFRKQRFGQSSGSVFEIVVQDNDDIKREKLVNMVMDALKKNPNITSIEPDLIPLKNEYIIDYDQSQLKRLSVSPGSISATLRTILNGKQLFTFFRNDEEIEVNLSVDDKYRDSIESALLVPVENRQNYLVPLNEVVTLTKIKAKSSIRRENHKRSSFVYADLIPNATQSPLDIAEEFETVIFPKLLANFPSSQLHFSGEVVDTRDSKRDLTIGLTTSILLIYIVLALLFNSMIKPLRIMLIIPFGVIGVIFAFYLHDKTEFGFYASIGTLGMLGVVVNDAIVMLSKLDRTKDSSSSKVAFTASVAKTRLRAIILTTLTTVAGVMPTAYGIFGTDDMLSDMMIAMAWGLLFGTLITLILIPCVYMLGNDLRRLCYRPKLNTVNMAILFFIGFMISGPTINAEVVPLSLDNFITRATKYDTNFHKLLIEKYTFTYDQDINVTVAELLFSGDSDYTIDSGDALNDSTISLSQTLPKNGQTFTASYALSDSDSSTALTSFTFSQDIAKNAFGKSVVLDSSIQAIKTDIAKHQLVEAYEDYMAELITLYYTWLRQYEGLQLAKSSYKENEKVLDSIVNRQKRKIANETDVNKLTLQILTKKEQVIRFESNYLETSHLIGRVIQSKSPTLIAPNTDIVLDDVPVDFEEEIKEIQSNSRTFIILDQVTSQTDLEEDRALRDLLPSVQLSTSIANQSSTYGTIGASISLPLFNAAAKATHEIAKLDVQKVVLETRTNRDSYLTTMRNNHVSLTTQKKLIDVAIQKRQLAQKILKEESENYSFGKITLNDYIVAVNRYDSARFDEIDRKITFQQISVEWKRLSDRLVVKMVSQL
jgi:multidrug efflux pump subunit AcrB/outer membrane protein TolC